MRKSDIDRLLENAVAKALGVTVPYKANRRRALPKRMTHQVKRAA